MQCRRVDLFPPSPEADMAEGYGKKGLHPFRDLARAVLLLSKAPQTVVLLPEGVDENGSQPDENDAGADADRPDDVPNKCVLFFPELKSYWVHVDPSNQDLR